MKIQLETGDHNLISHYGPGSISINGEEYTSHILITATQVLENWCDGDPASLNVSHFEPLLTVDDAQDRPEIVLLGTGENHIFPDMALLAELKSRGLAVEVMNTRAACRTYSVLMGEHRSVAAALIQF